MGQSVYSLPFVIFRQRSNKILFIKKTKRLISTFGHEILKKLFMARHLVLNERLLPIGS